EVRSDDGSARHHRLDRDPTEGLEVDRRDYRGCRARHQLGTLFHPDGADVLDLLRDAAALRELHESVSVLPGRRSWSRDLDRHPECIRYLAGRQGCLLPDQPTDEQQVLAATLVDV